MSSIDESKELVKLNRKAMSIKLHPKTVMLLECLIEETELSKTTLLERALWYTFDKGKWTDSKKSKAVIQELLEKAFPITKS